MISQAVRWVRALMIDKIKGRVSWWITVARGLGRLHEGGTLSEVS